MLAGSALVPFSSIHKGSWHGSLPWDDPFPVDVLQVALLTCTHESDWRAAQEFWKTARCVQRSCRFGRRRRGEHAGVPAIKERADLLAWAADGRGGCHDFRPNAMFADAPRSKLIDLVEAGHGPKRPGN
jgi:hypothetical protein